jgi:cytochrome c oxidase cbb3-type subunit 3
MTKDNKEKELLLDHDYDGIQEYDYPLPNWWLITFWGGIVFAVIYGAYSLTSNFQTIDEEFEQDYAVVLAAKEKAAKATSGIDETAYKSASLTNGKSVYNTNCLACHGENGKGGIGPNLADAYWLHGKATPTDIYEVIKKGVLTKGMPAWDAMLNKKQMLDVTAYIESIKGIKSEGEKAPQGEKVE